MPLTSHADFEKKAHPYTLLTDDPIIVNPLDLSNIWRASKTWVRAFENDPCSEYLGDGMQRGVWDLRLRYSTVMLLWYKNQIMFTAENGAAVNIEWSPLPIKTEIPLRQTQRQIGDSSLASC
ncbi:hypothetical protein D9619_000665 [Psilocybe cf. subviscida]|uniref:Uncharacterized protein n=1 Tax=Psilocybe cf. subviscida TaxID=2480587 RepID=A0A8H5F3H4_9AGAR|nr:hypothetical protein D9619_000665 [Psilocybe cf. subviscida]